MIALWLTLCTGPYWQGDCRPPIQIGQGATMEQCESIANVHRAILGDHDNYTLQCKQPENTMPKAKPRAQPMLQAAPVQFLHEDEWINPGLPDYGHVSDERYARYASRQKLAFAIVRFSQDAPPELFDRYVSDQKSPLADWQPTKPDGDGWFVWAITPSEQGPICWWCRHNHTEQDQHRIQSAEAKRARRAQRLANQQRGNA